MSNKPISFNKVDISKITFTKLEDNPRVASQKIGYIRYTLPDGSDTQFKVKTPRISSEVYGVPREGPYYPDARSRAHYKFGFCQERKAQPDINYDEIEQWMNLLIGIDEICDTDEFRKEHFGEKEYDKYAYQPLVRIPEEEVDEQGNIKYRPPYTKIKLDLEYCPPDQEVQSTKPTFLIAELKEGKRTNIELNDFDDAVKMLKYLNKLRFVVSFNKTYAQKKASGAGKNAKKTYGITLKATNIEVEQSAYSISANSNEDAFADSDTEEVVASNVAKITRNSSLKTGNLDEDIQDDEDEDEVVENLEEDVEEVVVENLEEEVVEEPPVKTKAKTGAPKKTKSAVK